MVLYTFLQILSVMAFEKMSIFQAFREFSDTYNKMAHINSWNYSSYEGTLVGKAPFSPKKRAALLFNLGMTLIQESFTASKLGRPGQNNMPFRGWTEETGVREL